MIVSGVVVKASLKIKTFSAFSTDELIDQYLDNFPAIISGCPKTTRFLLFVCDPFLFYLFVYCYMNSVKAATHVLDRNIYTLLRSMERSSQVSVHGVTI